MQKGIGTIHILVILGLLILAGSVGYVFATMPASPVEDYGKIEATVLAIYPTAEAQTDFGRIRIEKIVEYHRDPRATYNALAVGDETSIYFQWGAKKKTVDFSPIGPSDNDIELAGVTSGNRILVRIAGCPKENGCGNGWTIFEYSLLKSPTKKAMTDTSSWKTYRNEQYGFEVRYPENWTIEEDRINLFGVRILPVSKLRDVMIIIYSADVGRDSVFDEGKAGLVSCTIKTILFAGKETKNCKAESILGYSRYMRIQDLRGIKWEKNNEISLSAPAEYKNLIPIFDQILSTFKFIPLENQFQVSNTESKESVEYTTPGWVSPPLFRALQWLITLLIIAAFIFKFRPSIFKLMFSLVFAAVSLAFFNSCFIVDASLPEFCKYRILSFPVFVFVDPLGDSIRTVATRDLIMPIATPLIAFGVWYIIGSVLFAIYKKTLQK